MESYRVGIVGLSRGKGFVRVFSAHPRVRVTALCDLDEHKLQETGKAFDLEDGQLFTDYDEFVGCDFDIVVVATPIPFHTEHSIKAMQAGKHVLCEQTMAYTVEECEQVVNAVKRTGMTYMMAENYCYFHYVQEWKKMIDAGRLGKIVYAEAEYIHNIEPLLVNAETGERYWRHERPPMWYCAHVLGPLLYLTNDRIVRATGLHSGFNRWPDKTAEPGFMDMEVGLFQTRDGLVIKALRSQVPVRPHVVYYCLYGTKGSVENSRFGVHAAEKTGLLYLEDEMKEENNAERREFTTVNPDAPEDAKHGGHGTSEYYLIRDFLDAVEHGTKPPIDVIRAVDFTVPGLIAHESALQGGKWLDVPQFDW